MLPDDLRIMLDRNFRHPKSSHQRMVEEFMFKANQEVPLRPIIPGPVVRKLRAKIILEEALETIDGLGFNVVVTGGHRIVTKDCIEFSSDGHVPPDLVEIVDGCADMKVVTTGTLSACGVPDELIQLEVDINNLAKFGPGGYRREDGKWMKPSDHKPPRIAEIIEHLTE
jgi:predicted HAD superfamily Cof-like phosphohydrolase